MRIEEGLNWETKLEKIYLLPLSPCVPSNSAQGLELLLHPIPDFLSRVFFYKKSLQFFCLDWN
jgi:hypothetical protein